MKCQQLFLVFGAISPFFVVVDGFSILRAALNNDEYIEELKKKREERGVDALSIKEKMALTKAEAKRVDNLKKAMEQNKNNESQKSSLPTRTRESQSSTLQDVGREQQEAVVEQAPVAEAPGDEQSPSRKPRTTTLCEEKTQVDHVAERNSSALRGDDKPNPSTTSTKDAKKVLVSSLRKRAGIFTEDGEALGEEKDISPTADKRKWLQEALELVPSATENDEDSHENVSSPVLDAAVLSEYKKTEEEEHFFIGDDEKVVAEANADDGDDDDKSKQRCVDDDESIKESIHDESIEVDGAKQLPTDDEPVEAQDTKQLPTSDEPVEVAKQLPADDKEPVDVEDTKQLPVDDEPAEVENTKKVPTDDEPVAVENTKKVPTDDAAIEAEETKKVPTDDEPAEIKDSTKLPVAADDPTEVEDTKQRHVTAAEVTEADDTSGDRKDTA